MFRKELRPRTCGHGTRRAAKPNRRISAPARSAPLRAGWFCSREGFPKGRAAARPFVSFQGGAGGNRNPPAFLFRGLGGYSLFKREYPLGFGIPKRYVSAGKPRLFMKYPPDPDTLRHFPQCGPFCPGGCPPAAGQRPAPCAPRPPASPGSAGGFPDSWW